MEECGRTSGYMSTFDKASLQAMLGGTFLIGNWISMFETPEGAYTYLEYVVNDYKADAEEPGHSWDVFSVPSLGDETVGLKLSGIDGGELGELTIFRVVFREQNVVAGVVAAGLTGIAGPDDAIDLALIVASRIQSAN